MLAVLTEKWFFCSTSWNVQLLYLGCASNVEKSMPKLTRLRGMYRSNEIAVKGEAMYREGLVKDWAKPGGDFLPETNPWGRLSCEGGMGNRTGQQVPYP